MPFDNSPQVKTEIDILDEMKVILATPDKWCKGVLMDKAGAHCLVGSSDEAIVQYGQASVDAVFARMERILGQTDIAGFNDAPTTTHRDVLALIDRTRKSFEDEIY